MNWLHLIGGLIAAFSVITGLMMFLDIPRKLQREIDEASGPNEPFQQ